MADYPSASPFQVEPDLATRLAAAKERVWFRIGVLQSTMNDRERALNAFERVLAVNPGNVRAMTQAGAVLAKKECYPQAVAYLQRAIAEDDSCGEAWAVLAHCYVMTDDLQKAYQAYQSALSHLPNPRDPNLWYGIGLLYDRYGSLDNALEAFLAVLSISPDFERADEVCFCIGIIYKEQQNFDEALKYFNKVVVAANPPPPLTRADGWYQIGHVNELKRDIPTALEMYKRALAENPKHPKTLQNYGWLEHQHNNNSSEAIRLLKRSSELDSNDGQTWYLLGRVYMALREFRQAYDAYQQAVYRDGGNATFWCSIGVLYYQMNQYRDAMDAYSRAIRLNPYVSEVWYDLGTLYESCGQNADAIDAYRRAAELAPENTQITARLRVLENSMNPSTHPQPGTSQPQQSVSQPISQGQPQHIAPELQNSNQAHMQPPLNPVLGRTMGAPAHPLPQPSAQESKIPQQQPSIEAPQLHPPPHMSSQQTTVGQQHGIQHATPLSLPPRSGHIGIPSLPPPGIPSIETTQAPNGSYSHDGANHPAPLSSIQLPSPHYPTSGSHRLSVMSQPLPGPRHSQMEPSQPQSLMLAPPTLGVRQDDQAHMPRSTSLPQTQLQPLSKMGVQDQQQRMQHAQIAPIEPQQQNQVSRPGQIQPAPGEEQQHPRRDMQEAASLLPSQMPRHTSPQAQGQDRLPSPSEAQQQRNGAAVDHMQTQTPNSLPKIQSLNQMQRIPRLRQHPSEGEKKPEQTPDLGAAEPGTSATHIDRPIDRRPYGGPEGLRRIGFEGEDKEERSRLPALQKTEGPIDSTLPPKSAGFELPTSQPSYSAGLGTAKPPDQVQPIPDVARDSQPDGSAPPRSMSMHEITQSEPDERGRQSQTDKRPDVDAPDRSRMDHSRSEDDQRHERTHSTDQLPALRPLPGTMNMKGTDRDPRDDQKPLHSISTPALSLPSASALPSIGTNNGENPLSSPPVPGPSVSGVSSSLGPTPPSLPPLAVRTSGAFGSESKDAPVAGGQLTHGASSLTKFGKGIGRAPVTPVSNPVAPSSLPSPLPTRKNANSNAALHVSRSPRMSKPSGGPPFKSVPVAPSGAGYGAPIESVPSPSSLPVLPALSSRPSRDDGEKETSPDRKAEQNESQGAEDRDGQAGSKGSDKSGKDAETGGRRPEETLSNRPIFGMLRSAPAPIPSSERPQTDKDDGLSSPTVKSSGRTASENVHSSKREGSSKEDSGRTAKRPRLQDANEVDSVSKPFAYGGAEKTGKAGRKEGESDKSGDQALNSSPGRQSEIPSFKDMKAEKRGPSSSPKSDGEQSSITDGGTRNGDLEMSKGGNLSSQVADIPRLSNAGPKLSSSLPITSDTPLPSFRSERMNISAARAGNGGSGKSGGSESGGGLPFLRSAPVSSMPPPLKSMAVASGKGVTDRTEYGGDGRGIKSGGEDKRDQGAMEDDDGREKEGSEHVANGGNRKDSGSGSPMDADGQRGKELKTNEENSTKRTELHSSST